MHHFRLVHFVPIFVLGPGFFFFSSRRRHTRWPRDWSSDVCSSDLASLAEYVDAQEVIDVTAAGIAFYERAFDYDFPFRKYDQIFVPEYNLGAMENRSEERRVGKEGRAGMWTEG